MCRKYPCPCCGFLTLKTHGEYDVCPVCYWEDDPTQSADTKNSEGANHISLFEARSNYIHFGACEVDMKPYVREPKPEEMA